MEEHKLFNDRYFLERLLGRGNFSEVWLAKDTKTDIKVALKIYAPATGLDDAGLNVFAREFSLVVNANHKNLLKPLYYDSYDRKPFLVLPFCENGSILKNVGKMSEKDAWRLLRDVASGLAWLHAMNPPVIHQDIKPDNVMIGKNGEFMITDFGVSTHVKSTLRKSLSSAFSSAGTIAYMAPERFSKDNTPIMANDVYSLGATVYEMLSGNTPFGDDGGLIQMKGAEVPELKGDYSPQLKEVLARCLRTNPWERPTAEQLEKYAEQGLKGEKITFVGDKTFWQKYKLPIIIGIIVLIGAAIGGWNFMRNREQARQLEELSRHIEAYNDSIRIQQKALLNEADSLISTAMLHEEMYETDMLKALALYTEARDMHYYNDSIPKSNQEITRKINDVVALLGETYVSFIDKAEFFADEDEVAAEFRDRAKTISDIIDVTPFINNKSSESDDEPVSE